MFRRHYAYVLQQPKMNMMPKFLNSKTQRKIQEYICAYFYRSHLVTVLLFIGFPCLITKTQTLILLINFFNTFKITVHVKKALKAFDLGITENQK